MVKTRAAALVPLAAEDRRWWSREAKSRRQELRAVEIDELWRTRNPEALKPTAQTEARVKPDPIETMRQRGTLTDEECDAAHEIYRVYCAITAGLFAGARVLGRQQGKNAGLAEHIALAHALRYKPWADVLSKSWAVGGDPILEVIIDCVVDGRTCAEIDRDHRWRKGTTAKLIAKGLALYVRMARGNRLTSGVAKRMIRPISKTVAAPPVEASPPLRILPSGVPS